MVTILPEILLILLFVLEEVAKEVARVARGGLSDIEEGRRPRTSLRHSEYLRFEAAMRRGEIPGEETDSDSSDSDSGNNGPHNGPNNTGPPNRNKGPPADRNKRNQALRDYRDGCCRTLYGGCDVIVKIVCVCAAMSFGGYLVACGCYPDQYLPQFLHRLRPE